MNPFAFFLAIADKVHTALNLLDPTRTYAAADALWAQQRGAEGLAEGEAAEGVAEPQDACWCGHEWANHRVSAYGSDCRVPCGADDCYCVRSMDLVDVPAEVQPFQAFPGHQQRHPQHIAAMVRPESETGLVDLSIAHLYAEDEPAVAWKDSNIFRSGGQTKQMGPRPRISVPGPKCSDSDRLDHIAALLADIRDLLKANTSAAPASQTDAPGEASGVPEGVSTPDPDAPSGHLTLGNDPQSVHERALRQRTNEDRNPQRKGNAHA